MRKSLSRPRLSQPSGDGSQTVEFFFHDAHFSFLGELPKKEVTSCRPAATHPSDSATFIPFFSIEDASAIVGEVEQTVAFCDGPY